MKNKLLSELNNFEKPDIFLIFTPCTEIIDSGHRSDRME